MQPARGSELQKRAARLSIVMEDPQMRRPRFHAPRASLAFAEARHPMLAKTEEGQAVQRHMFASTPFRQRAHMACCATIVSAHPLCTMRGLASISTPLGIA